MKIWVCLSRGSHQRCSVRKGVLNNFAKFTGKHLRQSLMSKIKGRYNTEYSNLPAFHSPFYNMRASSMLRKEHLNEKNKEKENNHLFCFKVTTSFQYTWHVMGY